MSITKNTKKRFLCYWCRQEIILDSGVRSDAGKRIPHNVDGTKHDCPNSPYNVRKRQHRKADASAAA
jgi:hypothetical protein